MKPWNEIKQILDARRYGVLATQHGGQPHASLMAYTPMNGIRYLIVATYRSTLKYRSIQEDGRIAILINNLVESDSASQRDRVLTAHGVATDVPGADREAAVAAHLNRHPDLGDFLTSPDCSLMRLAISEYEVVGSTEDVLWYKVSEIADD